MENVKIYVLKDPNTLKVKYVGKTAKSLISRLQGHVSYAKRKSHLNGKHLWIRQLVSLGKLPIIETIEECNEDNWQEKEIYWIEHYSITHNLFNKTNGGEDWVFKSGNAPWNKGGNCYSDEMRQKMSNSHTGKTLDPEHKAKIGDSMRGIPKNYPSGKAKAVEVLIEDAWVMFESGSHAAKELGLDPSTVAKVCKKYKNMSQTKGYKIRSYEQ